MSLVDNAFAELRHRGERAVIPFVTAGDPSLEFTTRMLTEFAQNGVRLCEVGIPYSDPIADGPVVQASYTRALARGIRLDAILNSLSEVTPSLPAAVVT